MDGIRVFAAVVVIPDVVVAVDVDVDVVVDGSWAISAWITGDCPLAA